MHSSGTSFLFFSPLQSIERIPFDGCRTFFEIVDQPQDAVEAKA